MDRMVIESSAAEPAVPRALAAAGLGALAVGSLCGVLGKIVGWSPALAAFGGAMLGGAGVFAAVAWRKAIDPPDDEEELVLVESEAGHPEIKVIATFLRTHLGSKVTAYLSDAASTNDIDRWASGEVEPGPLQGSRLLLAYEATRLIVNAFGGETARAWFFGMNQRLNDEAPAYILRHGNRPEDWRFIIPAAREFVESAH